MLHSKQLKTDLVIWLSMRLPEARLEDPMLTVCSGLRPVGEANTGLTGPDMMPLKISLRVKTANCLMRASLKIHLIFWSRPNDN